MSYVVHDYGAICQAATELALELHAPVTTDEFHVLNRCLELAIAAAVAEHARIGAESRSSEELERVGQMAHEIRNRLNPALIAFDIIRSGTVSVNGSTEAVIGRSLLAISELVDSTLGEIRTAASHHRPEMVSTTSFLHDIAVVAGLQGERAGLQFVVGYTRPGGAVTVRACRHGETVHIAVQDQCGAIANVTGDPFQAFGEHRGRDRSGLGLGLSIARRAIRAEGGEINVRNMPGEAASSPPRCRCRPHQCREPCSCRACRRGRVAATPLARDAGTRRGPPEVCSQPDNRLRCDAGGMRAASVRRREEIMARRFPEVGQRHVPPRRRFFTAAAAVAGAGLGSDALAVGRSSAPSGPQATAPQTVLALGAHYDDCPFGISGVLIQAVAKGHRVVVLSLIGDYGNWKPVRGRGPAIVEGTRRIGADYGVESRFLSHASGRVQVTEASIRAVAEVIAEVKPDVAFLLWPRDQHPDHEAASAICSAALRLGDRVLADPFAPYAVPRRVYQYRQRPAPHDRLRAQHFRRRHGGVPALE